MFRVQYLGLCFLKGFRGLGCLGRLGFLEFRGVLVSRV